MFLIFKNRYQKNLKRLSDESLIRSFAKSRDNKYLSEIFNRYIHLIFGVCMKYLKNEEEAKDAVMQIFEKLITSIEKQEIENFKSWIYTVSKNHCLMKLRKEKAIAKNEERFKKYISAEIMELADEIHLNNDADGEDIFEKLNMAVKNLKNEQRVCIEMLYLQNKSYGDVAEVTGLTMKQVKSHIQNGKRNLKIYLEKRQSK